MTGNRAQHDDDRGLAELGLQRGERVRFRRDPSKRFQEGTVVRREADGSLGVRDAKGAARALRVDHVEVATTGPRGARRWEPVTERAARIEQLRFL